MSHRGLRFLGAAVCVAALLACAATPSEAEVANGDVEFVVRGALNRALSLYDVMKREEGTTTSRRSLAQAVTPEQFALLGNNDIGLGDDGFMELLEASENLLPQFMNNMNSVSMPAFGGAQMLGGGTDLVKQACNPMVRKAMNNPAASAMFPGPVKGIYNSFCDMSNSNANGFAMPGMSNAPSNMLVASFLGLPQQKNPSSVDTSAAAVTPPGVLSFDPFLSTQAVNMLPLLDETDENATAMDINILGVAGGDEAFEYASVPDFIPGFQQGFEGIMDFSSIFALEESLPALLDSAIDEAWEELGTPEQEYESRHAYTVHASPMEVTTSEEGEDQKDLEGVMRAVSVVTKSYQGKHKGGHRHESAEPSEFTVVGAEPKNAAKESSTEDAAEHVVHASSEPRDTTTFTVVLEKGDAVPSESHGRGFLVLLACGTFAVMAAVVAATVAAYKTVLGTWNSLDGPRFPSEFACSESKPLRKSRDCGDYIDV